MSTLVSDANRAVQFGRTLFGRSTFGRDSFEVPNLVDTRVLADTYLVDIVFWSTLCFGRHFGLVEPHLVDKLADILLYYSIHFI